MKIINGGRWRRETNKRCNSQDTYSYTGIVQPSFYKKKRLVTLLFFE